MKSYEEALAELKAQAAECALPYRWGMSAALAAAYGREFDAVDRELADAVDTSERDDSHVKAVKFAEAFLREKSHRILQTKWGKNEPVAIVSQDADGTHFTAVAARKGEGFGDDHLTDAQRRRFECVAQRFLEGAELESSRVFFDSIQVSFAGEKRAFVRYRMDCGNGAGE
jgi:Holliday junction resolvase-like predicted endonuclease